jgi:hypothetical protein
MSRLLIVSRDFDGEGLGTGLDWTGLGLLQMNKIAEYLTWNTSVTEADPPWRFSSFSLKGLPAPVLLLKL